MLHTPESKMLTLYFTALVSTARQRLNDDGRGERGAAEIATVVIVTAIVAAGAIAIATIIITTFTDKARTIPTGAAG